VHKDKLDFDTNLQAWLRDSSRRVTLIRKGQKSYPCKHVLCLKISGEWENQWKSVDGWRIKHFTACFGHISIKKKLLTIKHKWRKLGKFSVCGIKKIIGQRSLGCAPRRTRKWNWPTNSLREQHLFILKYFFLLKWINDSS